MKRYVPQQTRRKEFKAGDRVSIFDTTATVLRVGPEQSEVRLADGNVNIVCNSWMSPTPKIGV